MAMNFGGGDDDCIGGMTSFVWAMTSFVQTELCRIDDVIRVNGVVRDL
jgi:hypothetical protein